MPRYAKKGSTREDIVKRMIQELQSEKLSRYVDGRDIDYDDEDDVIQNYIHHVVGYSPSEANKDVSKIDFDFENSEMASGFFETLPDYTALIWCLAGGDWECPVYFCLYLDPDNHIRAYVPKDGNTYCHKCKCAWGTCECNDGKDSEDPYEDQPDYDAMYKDACNRIQTKE